MGLSCPLHPLDSLSIGLASSAILFYPPDSPNRTCFYFSYPSQLAYLQTTNQQIPTRHASVTVSCRQHSTENFIVLQLHGSFAHISCTRIALITGHRSIHSLVQTRFCFSIAMIIVVAANCSLFFVFHVLCLQVTHDFPYKEIAHTQLAESYRRVRRKVIEQIGYFTNSFLSSCQNYPHVRLHL